MTAHPLPPLTRWILFPLMATAGIGATSVLMTLFVGGSVLEYLSVYASVALSAVFPICLWHRVWFGALIAPVFAAAGLALVLAGKFETDVFAGLKLLFKPYRAMSGLILLATGWSLIHAAHLRRPLMTGIRALIWPSSYLLLVLVAITACAWQGFLFRLADWVLLGLTQFVAARIALAWARRRPDAATPPGGVAAPSADA